IRSACLIAFVQPLRCAKRGVALFSVRALRRPQGDGYSITNENLRPDPVLFSGKRWREAISSREDRLHRQARAARRTRSYCPWRENKAESKRALACLHDSFSSCVAHGAIPRAI